MDLDEPHPSELSEKYLRRKLGEKTRELEDSAKQIKDLKNRLSKKSLELDVAMDDLLGAKPCFACKHFKKNHQKCFGWEWRGLYSSIKEGD